MREKSVGRDVGDVPGLADAGFPMVERRDDPGAEHALHSHGVGIGIAEVAEDVVMAVNQVGFGPFGRRSRFFWRFGGRATRSSSGCGVSMPFLDFFRNARITRGVYPGADIDCR